ncbi:hypothetical protein GRF29_69g476550 [Pseudopithomyces chartarum]|uniref:Uncharacterized protein n=1 Tax=Pseudopithomyces chartarum TaxID=1892770 RepID=A0AAN6RHL9_9PLEO|nr:hypothetical protein GRF29_69g476550 [Pseudopithomyces chartarum]
MDHSDDAHSSSGENDTMPYKVGDILPLQTGDSTILVLIESISLPFTETCSMIVSFVPPLTNHQIAECSMGRRKPAHNINYNKAILKMFDWRYATGARTCIGASDWDTQRRNAYVKFLRSGRARRYLDCLRQMRMFGESERRRYNVDYIEAEDVPEGEQIIGVQHQETCLLGLQAKWYHREVAVYNRMRPYQGREIPRFISTVAMQMGGLDDQSSKGEENTPGGTRNPGRRFSHVNNQTKSKDDEFFTIRGILIEYIEGFSLNRLSPRHAPQDEWQDIFDQALGNTRLMSSNNILNLNVHPRDITVCRNRDPNNPNRYRIVNVDFRSSRLRRGDENDFSWRVAQGMAHEERIFGSCMQRRLRGLFGFDLDISSTQGEFQVDGDDILDLLVVSREIEQMQED